MRKAVLAAAAAVLLGSAAHGQSGLAPASSATSAERPPEVTPAPAKRPASAEAAAPAGSGEAEAPAASPVPPEDPDVGADAPEKSPAPAEPPVPGQLAEDDAGLAACLGRLRAYGTAFERVGPVSDTSERGGACGIVNPIRVSQIVPGVALEPAGVMRCATAAALADWVATFVLPASRLLPDRGPLTAVEHASTYVCRRIGVDGKLSQHAFGNAIDVARFRFAEGAPIPVESREHAGTEAEAFQRTARASACLDFTTVLGPGQEDHDHHLHLDIAARESGYRLCQ